MQALPKPVEKTGFHKINIPKPSFSRPNLSRPNSPKSNLQRQDGQQNQQPNAGSQRGVQQRPDNRQRNDRKPQGNTSRPHNNSTPLQESPKSLRQAPQKLLNPGSHRPENKVMQSAKRGIISVISFLFFYRKNYFTVASPG
jgi:hypothetical protein